ncbi:PTS sugar transporter subunit IIA [Vibrio barjaei]|uniref:PTS sugar transporter subunit IIA n=1 Tax=Vibrio barjaei TaxID=1676683 RepID=UPI0007BBABA9|nr:PTS sugar transporter subunit IIA [Vibrio barjaei]OIN27671.1 hypothetical protein AWH66_2009960 [Vibrio barjaei]
MSKNNLFKKELLVSSLNASTNEEVLRQLAQVLFEHGYVKESFSDAIVAREGVFPTGLGRLAIPHTDREHTISDSIAVAILSNPVEFTMMGAEDEVCLVNVVFMLAMSSNDAQIETLQTIMGYAQSREALDILLRSSGVNEMYQVLSKELVYED